MAVAVGWFFLVFLCWTKPFLSPTTSSQLGFPPTTHTTPTHKQPPHNPTPPPTTPTPGGGRRGVAHQRRLRPKVPCRTDDRIHEIARSDPAAMPRSTWRFPVRRRGGTRYTSLRCGGAGGRRSGMRGKKNPPKHSTKNAATDGERVHREMWSCATRSCPVFLGPRGFFARSRPAIGRGRRYSLTAIRGRRC